MMMMMNEDGLLSCPHNCNKTEIKQEYEKFYFSRNKPIKQPETF